MDYASFQLGMQVPPGMPSRGSVLHGTGKCRPCAWFWKASGCQNKENCGHCHLCPEGETKARKKAKQTLARLGLATPKPAGLKEVVSSQAFMCSEPEPTASPISVCPESEQGSTSISGTASNSEEETPMTGPLAEGADAAKESNEGPACRRADAEQLLMEPLLSPSQGSSLHGSGKCRPCAWFWKPVGCQNDKDCGYCHLCPETELKQRKKSKQTMLRSGLATPKAEQQEPKLALSLASATLAEPHESARFALSLASLI